MQKILEQIKQKTKLFDSPLHGVKHWEKVRELGWRERQKITVKKIKGGFVIRDWKKR